MSANYTSPKPDGTLATRNEVYQDRRKKLQARDMEQTTKMGQLPAQTRENYGKKTYK